MWTLRPTYREEAGDNEGSSGYDTSDWKQGLDGELQAAPALKDVKDVNSLAKQFVDLQQHMGRAVRVPGEDASQDAKQQFYQDLINKVPGLMVKPNEEDADAMNAFYDTIGRPKEETGYELPEVEGVDLPEDRANFLRKVAHKNGIGKKQFKGLLSEIMEADKLGMDAHKEKVVESRDRLKREWGEAYEGRENVVLTAAKNSNAPDEIVNAIEKGTMRGESLKWLYGLMAQGSEDKNFADSHGAARLSPSEAEAQINEIMSNKKGPYWDASDPAHKATVKKVVELTGKMNV